MDIIKYEIKRGDTLESIAEQNGISIKELVDYHNKNCGITQQIIGDHIPLYMENLLIKNIDTDFNKAVSKKLNIKNAVRYRTEQANITRIEEEVKSYSQLKKEYSFKLNLSKKEVEVNLLDYFYEFNPPALSRVFDFISKIDFIRNTWLIKINTAGRFLKIDNKEVLKKRWEEFKSDDLSEIEFVKVIKQTKPQEYANLIKQGDLQFSEVYDDEKDFNRDLFYLVLLDKYLTVPHDQLESEIYEYQSQLFPDVVVRMNMRYDILKIEGDLITVRKVWETIESDELLEKISNGYEKYHQPLIKYKFSNYKLDMRNLFTYNHKTKVMVSAELTIIENIENNIKSECIFNLKKIEYEE